MGYGIFSILARNLSGYRRLTRMVTGSGLQRSLAVTRQNCVQHLEDVLLNAGPLAWISTQANSAKNLPVRSSVIWAFPSFRLAYSAKLSILCALAKCTL